MSGKMLGCLEHADFVRKHVLQFKMCKSDLLSDADVHSRVDHLNDGDNKLNVTELGNGITLVSPLFM
jgi:hypothetical protein